MMLKLRLILSGATLSALICSNASQAATIMKLNLGNVSPDLHMTAGGFLSTADDGNAATAGNQDTAIDFTDFLEPASDVLTPVASFTLTNLSRNGLADTTTAPGFVIQNFNSGTFDLYSPDNTLLLSGSLTTSTLTGTLSAPGAGGVFSTGIVSVTGGVFADLIVTNSLGLSMTLSEVNNSNGFTVGLDGILGEFFADSSINISGNPTSIGENFPEPGSFILAAIGLLAGSAVRRRDG